MKELLSQFVVGLDSEIALIEKDSRDQSYELLSGQRDKESTRDLYVFVLADALRLPEDASGTLMADGRECSATVEGQEGNRLWLVVETLEPLPEFVPSARLVLNQTELLKRLKEKVQELQNGPLGLAPQVFGKATPRVEQFPVPPAVEARLADDAASKATLMQMLGSEVTYLWGPPGTGKTFSIAALVAALLELGETVLVTSHTHAAVEQALWALVEPRSDGRRAGFLVDSPLLEEGRVLKVGPLKPAKFPTTVQLDSYLDFMAKERAQNVGVLQEERQRLMTLESQARESFDLWDALAEANAALEQTKTAYEEAVQTYQHSIERGNHWAKNCATGQVVLQDAERSFFIGRSTRVRKANDALRAAQRQLLVERTSMGTAHARTLRLKEEVDQAKQDTIEPAATTASLEPMEVLGTRLYECSQRRQTVDDELEALKVAAADDARSLVRNASAIFVTLTKLYTDRNLLPELSWDTVIIDEASMAMPPLVALAAARARKRVVVVGDMYQLPPIVRSPSDSPAGRYLGVDAFKLSGVTDALDENQEIPTLARLMVQHRMHPDIAGVAKTLIEHYKDLENHPDVIGRAEPTIVSALGTSAALVVVDTADLRPWSGKMPGSLSRFNFLSGQIAVELAAAYASTIAEPPENVAPPIGVIAPYSAQRRYMSQLVQTLQLERWVTAGTVHTFQGNECDVIIFDSVLGEPHWTARLTDPHQFTEVRRDLNVAVTRARHQFVFIGDARWLSKNARPSSGYGQLWKHLLERATILKASDLVDVGLRSRTASSASEAMGWTLRPERAAVLTEVDFYPSFTADLAAATERVILYTPFIGKTRWPSVEPHIAALRERRVEVFILHKPLSDPEWRDGDPRFGEQVFASLARIGVKLIPVSGVHAKTIVIDGRIVYEGSLNWASQTRSYEHMWRFESKKMALLVDRMLRLAPVVVAYSDEGVGDVCPKCGGPLVVINQAQQKRLGDVSPVKLGCFRHSEDKTLCEGYLRPVDGRSPFKRPPHCEQGSKMQIHYTQRDNPWDWRCPHKSCRRIRWVRGDCLK
jgi:hypothetical protein